MTLLTIHFYKLDRQFPPYRSLQNTYKIFLATHVTLRVIFEGGSENPNLVQLIAKLHTIGVFDHAFLKTWQMIFSMRATSDRTNTRFLSSLQMSHAIFWGEFQSRKFL